MRTMRFVLVFLSLCALFFSSPAFAEGTRRFAVVAATNDGGGERVELRYAETDAEKFSSVMRELGGIHEEDLSLLLDVDHGAIAGAFSRLDEKIQGLDGVERVEVLFYYSGHSDEQGLLMGDDSISYKELREAFDQVQADVHIMVLDSCAAGALTRTKGGARRAAFLVDEAVEVTGHAFLTSSSEDEAAQESDAIGGSFFTHFLVSGLRGAADISGDERVTLNEAYQYAFQETLARTESTRAGPQHPVYEIQLTGTGDLVLTDLRETSSLLSVDQEVQGRFFIHQVEGVLIAELSSAPGVETTLNLSPGSYLVRVEEGTTLREASVTLDEGGKAHLASANFTDLEREVAVARGGVVIKERDHQPVEPVGDEPHMSDTPGVKWDEMPIVDMPIVKIGGDFVPGLGTSSLEQEGTVRNVSINLIGTQVAGVDGVQVSGVFAITERLRGLDFAGALSLAKSDTIGIQFSGAAAISLGKVDGAQFAGAVNMARGGVDGVQFSGAANVAMGDVDGVQFSGAANVAMGDVDGAMVSTANIATGKVDGVMVGVVNVAEDADFALGVVNIFWNGRTNVAFWSSGMGFTNVALRHGGDYFHYGLSVGLDGFGDDAPVAVGLGLGGHIPFSEIFSADIELYTRAVSSAAEDFKDEDPEALDILLTLQASFAWNPHEIVSIFTGPSYDLIVTKDEHSPVLAEAQWQRYEEEPELYLGGEFGWHIGTALHF